MSPEERRLEMKNCFIDEQHYLMHGSFTVTANAAAAAAAAAAGGRAIGRTLYIRESGGRTVCLSHSIICIIYDVALRWKRSPVVRERSFFDIRTLVVYSLVVRVIAVQGPPWPLHCTMRLSGERFFVPSTGAIGDR